MVLDALPFSRHPVKLLLGNGDGHHGGGASNAIAACN
jgi:hypothetical protein